MRYVLLGLMGAGTAVWIARVLLLWHFRREVPVLDPDPPPPASNEPLPRVSILVPAKDEEANIVSCLESLLHQDYPDFELVAVDDRSEDRTAEIIAALAERDGRLRLLRNADLPNGWTGKCHALSLGAKEADGEWLLFTDADTTHVPGSLRSAMAYAGSQRLDFLTLLPEIASEGLWEGAVQSCLSALFMSLFPPSMANGRRRGLAFANGQYILVRRQAYNRLGGHAAVRGEFLEDLALARLAADRDVRIGMAHGSSILRTRMYDGLRAVWRGWSRILYGSGRPAWMLVVWMLLSLVTTVLPVVVLCGTAAALAAGRGSATAWPLFGLSVGQMGLMSLCMGIFYRIAGCHLRCLPLHPVATVVGLGILANAVRLRWFAREVTWRGTTYRRQTGAVNRTDKGTAIPSRVD